MKRTVCIALALLVLAPALVTAQSGSIGLYTDVTGTSCSFSGSEAGPVTAYVVYRPGSSGIRAVEFKAPVPACLGAIHLSDVAPANVLSLGDSQTGVSVTLITCGIAPVSLLEITYYRTGTTDACCAYPVLPYGSASEIEASDCAFELITATGVVSHFNADVSCACAGNTPPIPPVNPVPPHNGTHVSLAPLLSWDSFDVDGNLVDFDVYFGTNPTPPLLAANVTENHYPAPVLDPLTVHYWRVVARDAGGLETSSATWTFTTKPGNSPPLVPNNPNPPDGTVNVANNRTLSWACIDPDGDPVVFDVYFGDTTPPPLVSSGQEDRSWRASGLAASTLHYWRVVARDPLGAETSGPTWQFTTISSNLPPAAPSNPVPVNNQTVYDTSPLLSWVVSDPNGNEGLTSNLYFGTSPLPPLYAPGLATPSYQMTGLTVTTRYYWRVGVSDGITTTLGPVWTFLVGAQIAPGTPFGPSPPNGGVASLAPVLSWQAVNPAGGGMTYIVYFGTSPEPPPVVFGLNSTFYYPGNLQNGVKYYWQIYAVNLYGGTLGPVWSFTASNDPVAVLISLFEASPSNGAVNVRWELKSDEAVERYTLFRREDSQVLPVQIDTGPVTDTRGSFTDASVEAGRTYHYELLVRSLDGDEVRSPVVKVSLKALELALHQNHPNPFNPQTTIRYDIPSGRGAVDVQLLILDVAGRVVSTLVNESQPAGSHSVVWNGMDERGGRVSSGVYFYVLDAGGERITKKLVLLK